jgi:FAD/FMN-containing dehydrogenase
MKKMPSPDKNRRHFIEVSSALAGSLTLSPGYVFARDLLSPVMTKLPSDSMWNQLSKDVNGRLVKPELPWANISAETVPANLKNPWYLEEQVGGTQSTGLFQAWTSSKSDYAIEAETIEDVVAGVNFARENKVRLVVKGTGHDYFGRSSAPNSLLIWTHKMRGVTVHNSFIPKGAPDSHLGVRALSVKAGNRWLEVYQAATKANVYVQGGGCTSVGACGGFALGGGFGSYSKKFGSGSGGVIELEVVTANGQVLTANKFINSDLFWALRGGGGGTFGIVTRMTLLAHDLPSTDGWLYGSISAANDAAYEELIYRYITFAGERLCNSSWGEGVTFLKEKNIIDVGTAFLDTSAEEAMRLWEEFLAPLKKRPNEFNVQIDCKIHAFKDKWNPLVQKSVMMDSREGAPEGYFWWKGNDVEVGAYWANYQGRGIPLDNMKGVEAKILANAIFNASRTSLILFQTNKGLAGQPQESYLRDITTSMNPAVFKNAGFVTLASWVQYKYVGIKGHEPDMILAAREAEGVHRAMAYIKKATPTGASYTNEGSYFEKNWQSEFWGNNYPRLLEIKKKYDPTNVFHVHNGVGSELIVG